MPFPALPQIVTREIYLRLLGRWSYLLNLLARRPLSLHRMKKFKAVFRSGKDGKPLQEGISSSAAPDVHDDAVEPGPSPLNLPVATFPEGIKELHSCDDAVVDVCFVHGLTGDREQTWTATSQEAPWPQLLLPQRLKHARILTWGYDAYLVRKGVASSNRLIDHSTNLVHDLTTDRAEHIASSRSLIFVTHSLGGLVCKMAITTSKDSPALHLKGIFTHVKGIVFMGTPHTGSWMADWAKIPAWGLGVVKSSNKSLLSILQTEDQLLESLQISFLSMIRDLRDNQQRRVEVTCFFEELPLPAVGKVVSKASATFSDHPLMSIYANHSNMVKFATVDDNGFKRVAGELVRWEQELSTLANTCGSKSQLPSASDVASAPPAHVYWMVTRSANPFFTGREDLLRELDIIVRDAVKNPSGQRQCRIVISGMGGQGKSEICLQLAYRLRPIFWGVFWIDVSATDLAERAILDVAQKLSISAQTWEDACLGIANLQRPWLLVLDNADDPDVDYQDYFPGGTRGVVLLTSRNDECQQYATAKSIALDGLGDGEARELLLKAARVPHDQYSVQDEDAKTVAGLLQSHSLALIQAGAYVSRGHCTLADYAQEYKRQRQRMLTFRPSQARSRYRDVYATFEVSAAMLANSKTEAARDALRLLPLLAVCGPSRLPLSLFEAGWKGAKHVPPDLDDDAEDDDVVLLTPWHLAHIPSLLDTTEDAWYSFRLVEAVNLLKVFSLVSTDCYDGSLSVSMHPLIHAWARDRQDEREQHQHWLQMGCVIAFGRGEGALWQTHRRQLQSHIEALTAWEVARMFAAESPIRITRVLVNCGWILNVMRADMKLYVLMEKIFVRLKLDRLTAEGGWLGVYDLAARNLINHGKVKDSVSLLEQVVKIRGQTLAEDHPSRLASQHALAGAYRANKQVKEAVSLLEQVVKIQEQTLAEDHPSRLASQHALAGAYQATGQVKEAVSLLEQVVTIREQTLAEDHPDRLASQAVLATVHWDLGHCDAAIQMMTHVVEIQRQVLDEHHPSRIRSEAWLEYFKDEVRKLEHT